ncbi:ABC transporter ATP-binding protein [bacterium]|nr:ABC transporter ATP-binding protein [bacterium]
MIINVFDLSKWYGQVIAVNNLTFSVDPGVTGFLGPNGAGKTTLMRMLIGQLKPSQGTITIDGETIWNNHMLMRRIGYCPEQDAFWQYLTGRDFVHALVRLQGFSSDQAMEKAEAAIRLVNMEKDQDRKIGSYSKGMRQRIKLAQAIAHDPDILFLDEPLNGLDPMGRHQMMQLIKELGNQGKIVVVSSHILHEVEAMTDTILLINHGRLLAQGTIYEIRKLIDSHPLQVTIRCQQVDRLTALLMAFEDVLSVHFNREKSQVTVETNQPELFHQRLPKLAIDENLKITSLWSPDENLDAIFDYLVGG